MSSQFSGACAYFIELTDESAQKMGVLEEWKILERFIEQGCDDAVDQAITEISVRDVMNWGNEIDEPNEDSTFEVETTKAAKTLLAAVADHSGIEDPEFFVYDDESVGAEHLQTDTLYLCFAARELFDMTPKPFQVKMEAFRDCWCDWG